MWLEGKVAVITGASKGIGKATAEVFAAEGAAVVVLDVSDDGSGVADEIVAKGGKAIFLKADVCNQESLQAAMEKTEKVFGVVDVLVNNAGITADSSLKKMTGDQFDRVINVNLKGVFNCTKVFGLRMTINKKGSIINAASVVAHYGNFGQTNYVASKTGVIGMTKTWARELGPKGVRVNAVAPGFAKTDMIKGVPSQVLVAMEAKIPLKRLATPQEIANVYLFLASDDASYVNGAILNVDGGLVF